jgi:hypothetical protein
LTRALHRLNCCEVAIRAAEHVEHAERRASFNINAVCRCDTPPAQQKLAFGWHSEGVDQKKPQNFHSQTHTTGVASPTASAHRPDICVITIHQDWSPAPPLNPPVACALKNCESLLCSIELKVWLFLSSLPVEGVTLPLQRVRLTKPSASQLSRCLPEHLATFLNRCPHVPRTCVDLLTRQVLQPSARQDFHSAAAYF